MKSIWIKNRILPIKKLDKNIKCEILIVGAGLTGLLCAYELLKITKDIVIIDSDEIGMGASGRSTGKISSHHGLNYQKIFKYHGKEKTKLYYEENQKVIRKIKEIIDEYNIDCDFKEKDSIIGSKSKDKVKDIEKEIYTYEQCDIPYEIIIDSNDITLGTLFKNQASFDPYKFCIQLAEKINIPIYEYTPMTHIHNHVVSSKNYHIQYENCILATQVLPFQFKLFYAITKPKISFLACLKPSFQSNQMYLIEDGITKTKNDYEEFMLIGGYDHNIHEDTTRKWQQFKRNLVLEYPKNKIECMWRSQDYEVIDYLPIIDKVEDFIVITGFNKWGNTNAYVASLVVSDILLNKETDRKELFKLKRKSLILNTNIITENVQVLKSLLLSKKINDKLDIPYDNEAISFTYESHPYGIYRKDNSLYIVDILCPHLGCTLKFNQEEKSWDCPCHGSRFTITGEIIKGPSIANLHCNICKVDEVINPK